MASENTTMGRNQGLTENQVVEIMENAPRPVWSARDMADYADVTRKTAHKRLKSLASSGKLESIQVGNATTAYYLVGIETQPIGDGEEPIKWDIRRSFEDKFVGDNSAPSQVSTFNGVAEAGDKIQFVVEGRPGSEWRRSPVHGTRLYENRRKELHYNETDEEDVQALVSGELYERPTVPIEHVNYPPDYKLELNIGPHIEETERGSALIATGVKNHLIRPCDDALFLENVEVEWLCPIGEGQELETIPLGDVAEFDDDSSKRPPEVQEALDKLQEKEGEDSPNFQPEPDIKADIVMLSDDCEPKRAYLEANESEEADYRVIPADFEGNELGANYEPTDQFKREVREKTAVDGELQFERTWMED